MKNIYQTLKQTSRKCALSAIVAGSMTLGVYAQDNLGNLEKSMTSIETKKNDLDILIPSGIILLGCFGYGFRQGYKLMKNNIYWDNNFDKVVDVVKSGYYGILAGSMTATVGLAALAPFISDTLEERYSGSPKQNTEIQNKAKDNTSDSTYYFQSDSLNQDY